MALDPAPLDVLVLGGTGTISASCVRLAVDGGMRVTVLNRGTGSDRRPLPGGVERLTADVVADRAVRHALGDRRFDAVVDFLSYDEHDVRRSVDRFAGRTRQYVHISSASIHAKPVQRIPITESTPVAPNPALPYASAKLRAELALQEAVRDGFPGVVVWPSHTYDDAQPPLPGDWTVVDRMLRGAPVPVHGDGTSLWTLTHAANFAQGLVGLLGDPATIGEVFTITGDDVHTWDGIYTLVARALGVEPRLVHVASELFPVVAPDWFWSGEVLGDIGHSAVFDTAKVRRFVPGYAPHRTFARAVHRMVRFRAEHPHLTRPDPATDAVLDRIVDAYEAGRRAFADRAPRT